MPTRRTYDTLIRSQFPLKHRIPCGNFAWLRISVVSTFWALPSFDQNERLSSSRRRFKFFWTGLVFFVTVRNFFCFQKALAAGRGYAPQRLGELTTLPLPDPLIHWEKNFPFPAPSTLLASRTSLSRSRIFGPCSVRQCERALRMRGWEGCLRRQRLLSIAR